MEISPFMTVDLDLLPETALTVAGLTDYLKLLLEADRELQQVWVVGEVIAASDRPMGTFFTLGEPDGSAVLRCVAWSSQRDRLAQQPVTGEQLFVLGGVRLYSKRGEYQLTVWQAFPAGAGLQSLRRRQLHARLEAEGLFAIERKRSLPAHPHTIAVVTSPDAAAWGDIQRTVRQRYPGVRVLLSPALVQGDRAPASVAAAIYRVERDGRAEVLVLARGGGAVEDLACFDDERIVRAIATCSVPVVTGIGHQRDESFADLVADGSAHTPTAAAERVVPDLTRLSADLQRLRDRAIAAVRARCQWERDRHERTRSRLQQLPTSARTLERASRRLQSLHDRLSALDPRAVLRRGYAAARRADGTLVRSAAEATPGDELELQLGTGTLIVRVLEIHHADVP
ncbi:exodeoxyribonuclease VII, large subunit [Rubidibacter lacunae KORDI 51-2]|uniref:Exodeoxyribonuclease 7 large subunit n=1 Tax=Rubidibacter lacunae KORDI 51-2 TaxID=582515 RepID=U5DBI4_9CHRO|nr:exodeoxyribonuclease VII, large subunit [Rubidibacter lacunae KORDI 51-2]